MIEILKSKSEEKFRNFPNFDGNISFSNFDIW